MDVQISHGHYTQRVHVCVMELLQVFDDVFFAFFEVAFSFVKHLIEEHFVTESLHFFLLFLLQRPSLLHDYSCN